MVHASAQFVAVLMVVVSAINAVMITGCAPDSAYRGSDSRPLSPVRPQHPSTVRVVSATAPPEIAALNRQPDRNSSVLAGALAGGGTAAGVAAGACTATVLCPPCYGLCVALWGLGGAAVGALGGHYASTRIATEPANRMLPDLSGLSSQFRSRVIRSIERGSTVTVLDGGVAALDFVANDVSTETIVVNPRADDGEDTEQHASDPDHPATNLEIALSTIHVRVSSGGDYKVTMTALARTRALGASQGSNTESFIYEGDSLEGSGGGDTDAARIAADVDRGMTALAAKIKAKFLGESWRSRIAETARRLKPD